MKNKTIHVILAAAGAIATQGLGSASGHGPLFGMATPTNVKGGFSLDFGLMGRTGISDTGTMLRWMLGYGITQDLQISVSAPYMFASPSFAPARIGGMMSGSGDLEAIGAWRFHRQANSIGRRFESTVYGGVIAPGPQREAGMMGQLRKAPGVYTGLSTGMASLSHYVWGGISNARFAESHGDRRPDLLTYSFVWGYRPPALRKEYPHWDWRFFGEAVGDHASRVVRAGAPMPGTAGHQVFVGPSILGIRKNIAIEGGVQFPVYRNIGPMLARERVRFAVNVSYFF